MISTAPKQTAFGRIAQTRALGGEQLTFTCFKIGNGELSSNINPDELTDLINPLIEIPIDEIDTSRKGYVKVIGKFNSTDIQSDFRWTELGLFCKINNEASGPYAYGNDGKNAGMLKANVSDVVADTRIALVIEIGDAENITAILSESVLYARKTDLDNHTTNAENPHNVTKAQVGLGNVPNVKTNDQTPTFSIASKLTELTSGEALGVSFGKIARAIRSLISHLGNKDNPHGITTATISAAEAEHTHSVTDINSGVLGEARGGTGVSSIAQLFNNAELTGSPKAPTASAGTSTKQIATTEFVMSAIKAFAQTTLDGTYAMYLFNKDAYGTVSTLGRKITLSQYENNGINQLPPQWVADGVTLPKSTEAPVISGVTITSNDDETICYEMLLYSNGEIWSRQAVLWWYLGGATGTYGEWQNNDWVNDYVAPDYFKNNIQA